MSISCPSGRGFPPSRSCGRSRSMSHSPCSRRRLRPPAGWRSSCNLCHNAARRACRAWPRSGLHTSGNRRQCPGRRRCPRPARRRLQTRSGRSPCASSRRIRRPRRPMKAGRGRRPEPAWQISRNYGRKISSSSLSCVVVSKRALSHRVSRRLCRPAIRRRRQGCSGPRSPRPGPPWLAATARTGRGSNLPESRS